MPPPAVLVIAPVAWSHMSPRFAPLLAASVALLAVAACTVSGAAAPTPAPVTPVPPVVTSPRPTPVPTIEVRPTPTPVRNGGDVEGGIGPELSVEFPSEDVVDVTLAEPDAKAWRLVVAGAGARSADRWEIVAETGDVGPTLTATEIQQGEVVDVMDLSGLLDGQGTAGGCHATLGVCLDASGFRFPEDGNGTFGFRLQLPDPGANPLTITGGTAGWPGEPFVLGEWTDTEAFPWG